MTTTPKLREYNAKDRELAAWVRDVRRNLVDEAPSQIQFRYTNDPITLAVPFRSKPSLVMVLSAIDTEDNTRVESCNRVRWTWLGSEIEIRSIQVSDTTVDYDVTLELRR